ncbi:hypothetical protein ACPA0F_18605 [Solibacillus silvestris]
MRVNELAKDVQMHIISGVPFEVLVKYDKWVERQPYATIISISQLPGITEGHIYLTIIYKEGEETHEIF